MTKQLLTGVIGTSLSAIGTITQTNEILQTISLIITICGAIISFIVLPILNWYLKAKKDGKIDASEIKDMAETINDGIEKMQDVMDDEQKKGK